jgi:hypothetical protein
MLPVWRRYLSDCRMLLYVVDVANPASVRGPHPKIPRQLSCAVERGSTVALTSDKTLARALVRLVVRTPLTRPVPVSQLAAASSELHILLADDAMRIINVLVVLNKVDSPVCPQGPSSWPAPHLPNA